MSNAKVVTELAQYGRLLPFCFRTGRAWRVEQIMKFLRGEFIEAMPPYHLRAESARASVAVAGLSVHIPRTYDVAVDVGTPGRPKRLS